MCLGSDVLETLSLVLFLDQMLGQYITLCMQSIDFDKLLSKWIKHQWCFIFYKLNACIKLWIEDSYLLLTPTWSIRLQLLVLVYQALGYKRLEQPALSLKTINFSRTMGLNQYQETKWISTLNSYEMNSGFIVTCTWHNNRPFKKGLSKSIQNSVNLMLRP